MGKNDMQQFLDAVNGPDVDKLLQLAEQHRSKKSNYTFDDIIKRLKEPELSEIWQKFFSLVHSSAADALQIEKDDEENSGTSEQNKSSETATNAIQTVVEIGILTLDYFTNAPVGLLQMSVFLHGIFLKFNDDKDYLKNSISQLCEKFWINDINGKEYLASNTILYILKKSLRIKGTKTDIKRAWNLRHALDVAIKSDDADLNEILDVLVHCVGSPFHLSSVDGQKLSTFIFTLNPSFIERFHESVKRHLPNCSMKQSEAYGKIYYNAWLTAMKDNAVELQEKLELTCIQDFMYYAVNVPKPLASLLRKLLSYFHSHKKEIHVSKMLRNLYEPILWRSLKAANGIIRANAANLFFDVFPLEDPDFNIADTEVELQRQLLIIKDLLVDEYPAIRCIAAIGVGFVMNLNWELVSHEMIKSYFKILVDDLSCDSASSDVRCAVIKCMKVLLENHLAIPTLKSILPKLWGCFHDISEKVRIAFCHLLLDVKKVCSIKYWDVVPLDHLLARLEEDKSTVARLIVKLIYNSYIPDTKPEDFWLSRCIELIKMDRGASRVFFQYVHEFISLEATVKFIIIACRTLSIYVQSKLQPQISSKLSIIDDNKENMISNSSTLLSSFAADGPIGFDNPSISAGVIDAIAILWISVQTTLNEPANKSLYKQLLKNFMLYMPTLLKYFKDNEVWTSIFYVCGFLPSSYLPNLADICFMRLKNLSEDSLQYEYGTLLVCLCNQNKCAEVIELIDEWLSYGLDQNKAKPPQRKRKTKSKGGTSKNSITPKPYLAIEFLDTVLEQTISRKAVLKSVPDMLKKMVENISTVCTIIENARTDLDDEQKTAFVFKVYSNYVRIAVLLQGENAFDGDLFVSKQLTWASKLFLRALPRDSSTGRRRSSRRSKELKVETEMWKQLGINICKDLVLVSSDMILIGLTEKKFSTHVEFAIETLNSENCYMYIANATCLLFQISDYLRLLTGECEYISEIKFYMPKVFRNIVLLMKNEEIYSKIPGKDLTQVKNYLKEFLSNVHKLKPVKEFLNEMIPFLHSTVLEILSPVVCNLEEEKVEKIEVPHTCTALLSSINTNIELFQLFFESMCSFAQNEDLSVNVACCIAFSWAAQDNKNVNRKAVIQELIKNLEKNISRFNIQDDETDTSKSELVAHAKKEIAVVKSMITRKLTLHTNTEESQS